MIKIWRKNYEELLKIIQFWFHRRKLSKLKKERNSNILFYQWQKKNVTCFYFQIRVPVFKSKRQERNEEEKTKEILKDRNKFRLKTHFNVNGFQRLHAVRLASNQKVILYGIKIGANFFFGTSNWNKLNNFSTLLLRNARQAFV